MAESLKGKFLSGTFWTTGEQVILTLLGLVQLAITSRLLTPVDFGIYATAVFFSSLGTKAFSFGFSAALIQKKGDVDKYLDTTWTASIGVATIASLIIAAFIPLICRTYYHNEAAIGPSLVVMLNCIFLSASNPGMVKYMKAIDLKKIFWNNVLAKLFSFALIVVAAYVMRSYWALVIALLAESLFRTASSYFLCNYRPKMFFSWAQFKELYSFSGWIQLKNIVSWLAGNVDVAIVGNALGAQKLGFYNRAQTVSNYPRTFIDQVVNSVAYPIYAKINDDLKRVQLVVDKIQNTIILILAAIALLFVLYSKQIILLVLGDQWTTMVVPFQMLGIAYLLQTLLFSYVPVLRAFGYSKQEFLFTVVKIIVMVIFLYPLVRNYELTGAAAAIIIAVILNFPILLTIIRRKTGLGFKNLFLSVGISAVAIVAIVFLKNLIHISFFDCGLWWIAECCLLEGILVVLLYLVFIIFKAGPGQPIAEVTKKFFHEV